MAFSFIDKKMIPSKLVFLASEGYIGSIVPFLNIFYVSLGMTATEAGLITGISYTLSAVISPLWSLCADVTGHRRVIYLVLNFGTISTVFSMPWVVNAVRKFEIHTTCSRAAEFTNVSYSHNDTSCKPSLQLVNQNDLFYTLLVTTIAARAFFVTLPNYIDAYIMNVVKSNEKGATYGAQRVFGSIGFGAANFLTGVIIDAYKPADISISRYTAAFFVFLPLAIFLIPAGYILIGQAKLEDKDKTNEVKNNIGMHLKVYLQNLDNLVFLVTVTISGLSLNILLNFLFMLMDDYMNSSKTLMTATILFCQASELLAYPLASKFIHYMKGTRMVMTIGIFTYFPRFMLMSYVKNPWLMLPIQLLHPFGFALSWVSHLEYTFKNTPEPIKMTLINTVSSIHFVLSSGVANMVGGVIYSKYGGRVLFRANAILCLLWAGFMVLYYGIKKNRRIYTTKRVSLREEMENVEDLP